MELSDNDELTIFAFSDWRTQSVSDLYSVLENIDEDIDVIIYGGDDVGRFVDTTRNHFHKMAKIADAELGYVLGNDDIPHHLRHFQIETSRVHDLHRNPLSKGDITFIGQEGDVGEPAMSYIKYSDEEARSHLSDVYNACQNSNVVLVSHTPPYGSLDYAQRFSQQRIGSDAVREFAGDVGPEVVICGHVHQFGGKTDEVDYGPVANVASHDYEGSDGKIGLIKISIEQGTTDITHTSLTELFQDLNGIDEALKSGAELTKLAQVGAARSEKFQQSGIESITQIAANGTQFLTERCTDLGDYFASIIYHHATAYVENKTIVTDDSEFRSLRNEDPILVDVETNLAQDRVWCIGAYDYTTDEFSQFIDLDDEENLITEFKQYLSRKNHPEMVSYSGTSFDENMLLDAAERHGQSISDYVGGWTDLFSLAKTTVFFPKKGRGLDNMASTLGYEFAYPNVTGLEVGSAYSTYLSENEEPDKGWRIFLEYNLDDTIAMKQILDVLSTWGKTSETVSIAGIDEYDIADQWEATSIDVDKTDGDTNQENEKINSLNVSEILESTQSVAKWNEENPINDSAIPEQRCYRCGEPIGRENCNRHCDINSVFSEDVRLFSVDIPVQRPPDSPEINNTQDDVGNMSTRGSDSGQDVLNEMRSSSDVSDSGFDFDDSPESDPASDSEKRVLTVIKNLEKQSENKGAPQTKVIEKSVEEGLKESEVEDIITDLRWKGEVYNPSKDCVKTV